MRLNRHTFTRCLAATIARGDEARTELKPLVVCRFEDLASLRETLEDGDWLPVIASVEDADLCRRLAMFGLDIVLGDVFEESLDALRDKAIEDRRQKERALWAV